MYIFLICRWEEYVRRRHTEFLKSAGQVEQLEDVNFVAALDLLCEQGQWKKCLERARKNEGLLHHYAGKYVYHLLKQKQPVEAMHIYIEHGVPANKHHYPLYRGISEMIFMDPKLDNFENWMHLRNLLFQLVSTIFRIYPRSAICVLQSMSTLSDWFHHRNSRLWRSLSCRV